MLLPHWCIMFMSFCAPHSACTLHCIFELLSRELTAYTCHLSVWPLIGFGSDMSVARCDTNPGLTFDRHLSLALTKPCYFCRTRPACPVIRCSHTLTCSGENCYNNHLYVEIDEVKKASPISGTVPSTLRSRLAMRYW